MLRLMMPRRALLQRAAAAAGMVTTLRTRTGRAAAPDQLLVYVLLPSQGLGAGRDCNCTACHRHAANKVFASRLAAETQRAHPHCRCAVVERAVPSGTWVALFGQPDQAEQQSRDRREVAVAALLGRA
jgi:hypothetical protein